MEAEGRSWILIGLLVLLGIGVAIFLANKVSEERERDRVVERQLMIQSDELERMRAENEALRNELERARSRIR